MCGAEARSSLNPADELIDLNQQILNEISNELVTDERLFFTLVDEVGMKEP